MPRLAWSAIMASMIEQHYQIVRSNLQGAALCIVSKKRSIEQIKEYYDAGCRIFGENRAQELCAKARQLPSDIEWHFIGHLQRNKIRLVLPYVTMIQSLDSATLAQELEKEAARIDKTIDVLVEVHMAEEDTQKSGIDPKEAGNLLKLCHTLPHVNAKGIMAMGPHTDNEDRIREVFRQTRDLYVSLAKEHDLSILSMGMSDDYRIALACGSTMVRIGSYLFEED